MTKEKLIAREKLLQQEREKLVTLIPIYDGALQEVRHWLSQIEEK